MTDPIETYLRINPDGSGELVTTQRSPREITEPLARRLSADARFTLKNAFSCGYGEKDTPHETVTTHVIHSPEQTFCIAELFVINLTAHWELRGDNILCPRFLNKDHNLYGRLLQASALWTTPFGMRLLFCTEMEEEGGGWLSNGKKSWLIAYDHDKRAYLLPLGNLYDDAAVCMGVFNGRADTLAESFELALKQFYHSAYNADLAMETEKSDPLFRFKMADKLTQEACILPWEESCGRIGTHITAMAGGLL